MFSIYRSGEGYWTRVMTAIAAGILVAIGARWVANILRGIPIGTIEPIYTAAIGAVVVIALFAALIWYFVGRKPASVDFLVATEVEMKAVNWSTRREIVGSTWVVLFLAGVITLFVFAFDILFSLIFTRVGVLDVGA